MTGSPLCRLARTWSASLLQQLTLKYDVSASRHCPVALSRKRGVAPTRTLVTSLPVAVVRMFGSWATKPTRVTYPPWLISILLELPVARCHRVPSTVPGHALRHRPGRSPVDNRGLTRPPVDNYLPFATWSGRMPAAAVDAGAGQLGWRGQRRLMRATSSGVREKLKRSRFCSMRSGREDLGMTMTPISRCQRRITWAGVTPWEAAI